MRYFCKLPLKESPIGMRIPRPPSSYLWTCLKPYRWAFLGVGVLLFLQIAFTIIVPLPVKFILNHVVQGNAETTHHIVLKGMDLGTYSGAEGLLLLSFLAFALGITLNTAYLAEQMWSGNIAFRLLERMRRDFFHRIFTRRQSYLDSKKKVDLVGRVSSDISNIEILITNGIPAIVRDIPMLFVLIAMMFLINVKLTLIFCLCLPVFYITIHVFTAKMRVAARDLRKRTVNYEEESYEAMNSMAIVKSLRGEEKLLNKLLGRIFGLTKANKANLKAAQGLEFSMGNIQYIVRGGFLFLGCWAIFRKEIGLGDLFQILAYMDILSRHVNNINKFLSKYPKFTASLERLKNFDTDLEQFPEISGRSPLHRNNIVRGETALTFVNTSFQHNEEKEAKRILERFNLSFPKNHLIAIVGQSGLGKSTFSRLLNRLHDPQEGRIEIAGGQDLREFDLKDLRSLVRIISQEIFLVSGTVRENLLLASKENISEEEILTALKAVNALEFVQLLPQGLDTKIGEGGLQLSGGQAKRIHLARAFLDLESEIVLFDEPTTGLDTLSSQIVMKSIKEVSHRKTLVLWITHRMQEVFAADQVLFFQSGGNPIFSTHTQLFAESSTYRALMETEKSSPVHKQNALELPEPEEHDPLPSPRLL